jgi:hypothetical protein
MKTSRKIQKYNVRFLKNNLVVFKSINDHYRLASEEKLKIKDIDVIHYFSPSINNPISKKYNYSTVWLEYGEIFNFLKILL